MSSPQQTVPWSMQEELHIDARSVDTGTDAEGRRTGQEVNAVNVKKGKLKVQLRQHGEPA